MKWLAALILLPTMTVSAPSALAQARAALPVGPGVQGSGPWVIGLWLDKPCNDCAGTVEDAAAAETALISFLNNDDSKVGLRDASIRISKLASNREEASTTLGSLSKTLAPCAPEFKSFLRRVPLAGPGTSLGVAFKCPGREDYGYLSISVRNQRVTSVYWLPEAPIYLSESK